MAKRNSNRELYAREAKKLRERIKTAEKRGFIFGEDIQALVELPKRVTKKSIEKIKNLRGIWLRREAEGYKTGDNNGTVVSAGTGLKLEREKIHKVAKETIRIHKIEKRQEKIHQMEREWEREHPEFFDIDEDYEPDFDWSQIADWQTPSEAETVISNFEEKLESIAPTNSRPYQGEMQEQFLDNLRKAFYDELNKSDRNDFARRLQENANELNQIMEKASFAYRDRNGKVYNYSPSTDFARFLSLIKSEPLTLDEAKSAQDMQDSEYDEEYEE